MACRAYPSVEGKTVKRVDKGINEGRDDRVIQIFVFRGEEYLGWDCFQKESIVIGRSSKADLIIDDADIAAFQAIVGYLNGTISVDLFESKSNRKTTVRPGQFDSIEIGAYKLKIKVEQICNQSKRDNHSVEEEINTSKPPTARLETEQSPIHKSDCEDRPDDIAERTVIVEKTVKNPDKQNNSEEAGQPEGQALEKKRSENANEEEASINVIDWEDEDDDIDAFLSHRDKILEHSGSSSASGNLSDKGLLIEVIKIRNDKVYDVSFLSNNQKYVIENNSNRFCLAENKQDSGQFVYFKGHHTGKIQVDKSGQQPIETLCTPNHIFHKRKKIYRYPLPENGIAVIYDDPFEYRLKAVKPDESPTAR